MKTVMVLMMLVFFLVGTAVGGWYMNRKANEMHTHHEVMKLYRKSAQEMDGYLKLLRLTRNEEKEPVIRYLETLLGAASATMNAIKHDVPEELRRAVEADYMTEYRKEHSAKSGNAP